MAAQDAVIPDLQLGDIIHSMSPSPTPQQTDAVRRSASLEPLTESEISSIRRRITEIDSTSGGSNALSHREEEMLQMLRRLTESPLFDQSQLIYQAEMISGLGSQRDFLLRQVEEERARWASQKDGWERMAEALIAQRNKVTTGEFKDDLKRSRAALEFDNGALKEKLDDTRTRLQCLENEITKLRPILLMQPVTTANGYASLPPFPYPNVQVATDKLKPKKKKKEPRVPVYSATTLEEPAATDGQAETQPMEGVERSTTSSSFFQFQAQHPSLTTAQREFTGDHYRKPTTNKLGGPLTTPPTTLEFRLSAPTTNASSSNQTQMRKARRPSSPSTPDAHHPSSSSALYGPSTPRPSSNPTAANDRTKSKRSQGAPLTPLMSDARAEHLLLAARRIGRVRVGIMASHVQDKQRESEALKDRQRLEQTEERNWSYYRQDPSNMDASGVSKSPRTPTGFPRATASPRTANSSFAMVRPASNGVGGNAYTKGYGKGGNQQQLVNSPTTPRSRHRGGTASGTRQMHGTSNPPTPLLSLLDAARMMDNDSVADGGSSKARSKSANGVNEHILPGRRRAVVEEPESPVPKRRRVTTMRAAAAKLGAEEEDSATGIRRVKSALDVLADQADQAAAFSSHDQRSKGKGREMQSMDVEDKNDASSTSALAPKKMRRSRSSAAIVKEVVEKPKYKPTTRRTRGTAITASMDGLIFPPPSPEAPSPHTLAVPRMISPPVPRMTILDNAVSTDTSRSTSQVPPSSIPSPKRMSPASERAISVIEEQEEVQDPHADPEVLGRAASDLDIREQAVSMEASSSSVVQVEKPSATEPANEVVQEMNGGDKPSDEWKRTMIEREEPQIETTPVSPLPALPVEIPARDKSVPGEMIGEAIGNPQEGEAGQMVTLDIQAWDFPGTANQQVVEPLTAELGGKTLVVASPISVDLPPHIPLPRYTLQLDSERSPPSQISLDSVPNPLPTQETSMDPDNSVVEAQAASEETILEHAPTLQPSFTPSLTTSVPFTQQVLSEAIIPKENNGPTYIDADGDIDPQSAFAPFPHTLDLSTQPSVLVDAMSQKESDEIADIDADGDIDIEDADADADADGDVDAEADMDDGEIDAEGEVDAEGDPDPEEMEMTTQILDGLG